MGINDPRGRWVVVPQYLKGTDPTHSSFHQDVASLFQRGQWNGFTVADFFAEQTLGVIDATQVTVLPLAETSFDIYSHPGQRGGVARPQLVANARALVTDGQPYRGVLAVYNYVCNSAASGTDVVWSLEGYGSVPQWADAWLHQCRLCRAMVTVSAPSGACAAGAGGHDPTGSWSPTYMSITDPAVPMTRQVASCGRCDVLYASDRAADPGVTSECPAGGQHQKQLDVRVLAAWPDPPAEATWTVCKRCRALVADNSVTCPADAAGHSPEQPSNVHFPFLEFGYLDPKTPPRSWLAHEMSHAYGSQQLPGFVHGRGLGARSTDLGDDCWPGAYGDRYDVMSFDGVDPASPAPAEGPQFGVYGPSLSITQLVRGGILDPATDLYEPQLGSAAPFQIAPLRSATAPRGTPGWAGAWFGEHLVEYRRKSRWDGGITTGSHTDPATGQHVPDPGVLLVRHVPQNPQRLPNLVPTVRANAFLGTGDRLESRVGIDNVAVELLSIAADGTTAEVQFTALPAARQATTSGPIVVPPGARSYQRWLVIPYAAADSTAVFSRKNTAAVLEAAGQFWTDMADGQFFVAGGEVLGPDLAPDDDSVFRLHDYTKTDHPLLPPDPGGQPAGTHLTADRASLALLSPATRAGVILDQVLSAPNPTNRAHVLPVDLRWFTGLIMLSLDGLGDGLAGSLTLPSGVVPHTQDCGDPNPPDLLDPLPFDVIELPTAALTQARLAREIGLTLGFPASGDPFSLTGPDPAAHRYVPGPSAFGDSTWGPTGPAVSTGELQARGWLGPGSVWTAPGQGNTTSGVVSIYPFGRPGHSNPVRAEVGPYAFELRPNNRWDSGVGGPVVLAYDAGPVPRAMAVSDGPLTWGGPIPEVTGGGSVRVAELDNDHATLVYSITPHPVFVAGGGTLHGGGTILVGPDGHIHRIPQGGPLENEAQGLIRQLGNLAQRLGTQTGSGLP